MVRPTPVTRPARLTLSARHEVEGRRLAFNVGLRQAALLRADSRALSRAEMSAFAHR